MKHTSGPWQVNGSEITARGAWMLTVCSVGRDANARLIAASPDLLKACKLLHDADNACIGTEYGNQLLHEALKLARSAMKLI